MYKIYSITNYPNYKNYKNYKNINKIYKIQYIKDIIQDLENYGPAGLIHIAILSNIIQRPIKIWNANGSLNKIIGKRKTGHPIDIEYHAINSEGVGHWTLKGGKDPDNVIIDLNSCLFSVIGSQIGQDPLRLRKWTQLNLKINFQNLVKWIDKILQLEENDKTILMIGGARYKGTTVKYAKELLDRSQNQRGNSFKNGAGISHVRGHAPEKKDSQEEIERKEGTERKEGIEYYSINNWKTGFLSQADMDFVVHYALRTETARQKIKELRIKKKVSIIISFDEIERQKKDELCEDVMPTTCKSWIDGEERLCEPITFTAVKIVVGHFENKSKVYDEDVWILTCYPIAEESVQPQFPEKSFFKKIKRDP